MNSFNLPVTENKSKGQGRMWAIYPLPGDMIHSIRVNQLIDPKTRSYLAPRIEISQMWLEGPYQLQAFRVALDQAELKAAEYGNCTGDPCD